MKKSEALQEWRNLPEGLPIAPHFESIPYKRTGSKYGACGIRIDGNPDFVRAVLSRLKDLLPLENCRTRLGLAWAPVDGTGLGKELPNTAEHAECCYIRLHERGSESQAMRAMFPGAFVND